MPRRVSAPGFPQQTARMRGHEIDGLGGHMLGCENEVTLVLAILFVDKDHHAPARKLGDNAFDGSDESGDDGFAVHGRNYRSTVRQRPARRPAHDAQVTIRAVSDCPCDCPYSDLTGHRIEVAEPASPRTDDNRGSQHAAFQDFEI